MSPDDWQVFRKVVLALGKASRPGNSTDMHEASVSEALKIIDEKIGERR